MCLVHDQHFPMISCFRKLQEEVECVNMKDFMFIATETAVVLYP